MLSCFANALESTCLPAGDQFESWPIRGIYLHGLFPKVEDKRGFLRLEENNRQYIEQLALKQKIRISVPVGDFNKKTKIHSWNNIKVEEILKRARVACNDQLIPPQPDLIGFSNGGYISREIALNCIQAGLFGKIFSIGAPKNLRPSRCGSGLQLINFKDHEMPPLEFFERYL